MNWKLDAISEFGRRMGLEGWTLNAQGVAQMQFPSGALLAVEPVEEEVLVYTVHDASHAPPAQWLDALKRCHTQRRGSWPMQVGCRTTASGTEIVVLTRVPERALTAQHLEEAVLTVLQWRDNWASGALR